MTMWIIAGESSSRQDTELQIWRSQIRCPSGSSVLHSHVSCIVAIPRHQSLKTGCALRSKATLFVAILNSCGLNQSFLPLSKWNRQHRRSRLLHPTRPFSSFFQCSRFPLGPFLLSALCFTIMSNLKFICSRHNTLFSLSAQTSANTCPGDGG